MTRGERVRLGATFVVGLVVGIGIGLVVPREGPPPAAGPLDGTRTERMSADPVDPRAPIVRVTLNGPANTDLRCSVNITGGSGDQPSPPPPVTVKLDTSGRGGIRLDYSRNPESVSGRTFTITCAQPDGSEFGRIAVTVPRS